jgi:hypothetical protein
MSETEIINRVASSPLKTIDLSEYLQNERTAEFDLKRALFQELILREKDFRQYLKEYDWTNYKGAWVRVHCSADAIVPMWAYMLVSTYLSPVVKGFTFGSSSDLQKLIITDILKRLSSEHENAKVVIKGCSSLLVPEFAYLEATKHFLPVVSSLMYGEPCSTVPIYKAPKK